MLSASNCLTRFYRRPRAHRRGKPSISALAPARHLFPFGLEALHPAPAPFDRGSYGARHPLVGLWSCGHAAVHPAAGLALHRPRAAAPRHPWALPAVRRCHREQEPAAPARGLRARARCARMLTSRACPCRTTSTARSTSGCPSRRRRRRERRAAGLLCAWTARPPWVWSRRQRQK